MSSRRIAIIVVAGTLVLLAFIAIALWFIKRDTRQDLNLSEVVRSATQSESDLADNMSDLKNQTARLCEPIPGCIEGYASQSLRILRFSSKDDAAMFVAGNPESYQSDWIVINYPGDALTDSEKDEIESFVDTLWTSG
jgi:hypothetical protein